jgi:two-component system sensor histidine kinase/response regulator
MRQSAIRVLLVEDREEDYLLTRRLLSRCENQTFDLEWANSWQTGIEAIRRCAHEVCLLDFRIGGGDGLELLKESRDIGCQAPIVVLTGVSDYRLDVEAMKLGAMDFLVKDKITPELLERSIRFAITQGKTVDELRRRQDEICASELRFRSVVQSAADAIILYDENGKILFWNQGAAQIFGYSEEEIVNQSVDVLMPEPYRAAHRENLERFRATGRSQMIGNSVEVDCLRKDGSFVPVELSLASWANGGQMMLTAIIRDISERRKAAELYRAKDAAEEASRAKSSALAHMSHELRTPLQSIIGFTNLLLQNNQGNLTPHDLDFLGRILLNAKVEAGRMDLQLETVSIDGMIRDVVKQLEAERQSPDVQIVLQLPQAVRPARTDAQKLKQVLINIVDNALKFTTEGTVTVALSVSVPDLTPTRIDVTDTGSGMPPERISEIFEPFRQLASDSHHRPSGTGLGLSICRSFCDLLGYELQVQSEPGHGSKFSIVLSGRARLPLSA